MDGYFILQSSTLQVVVEKCTYRKLWIKRTALQLVISTNKALCKETFFAYHSLKDMLIVFIMFAYYYVVLL